MKRFFTVCLICLGLVGCMTGFDENRETRSTVYVGQTTWDMYENFGVPTQALKISPEEIHFFYHREAITRDWTKMYYNWCDMRFVAVNDRIVNWTVDGNQCHVNVAEPVMLLNAGADPVDEESGLVLQQNTYTVEDAYYPADDEVLF